MPESQDGSPNIGYPSEQERREAIERLVEKHRAFLDDPRMADDYNPDTGDRDGVPYWERERPLVGAPVKRSGWRWRLYCWAFHRRRVHPCSAWFECRFAMRAR